MRSKHIVKIIPALLLAVLVFAACARNIDGGSEKETGGSAGTAETGDKSAPADTVVTENNDAEKDENGFFVFPEGNYIKNKKFDTADPLPDYDAPLSFAQTTSCDDESFCEGENGWYSVSRVTDDDGRIFSRIDFTDKKTGAVIPLCGKPECDHNDLSCGAGFQGRIWSIQMYDGMLYCITDSAVYKMEPDGAKREKVSDINDYSDKYLLDHWESDRFVQIHRGYMYFFAGYFEIENGKPVAYASITARSLDGSETFRVLDREFENYTGGNPRVNVRFFGNDMYIMVTHHKKISDKLVDFYADFYKWDIKTRQGEAIWTGEYPDRIYPLERDFMPVPGDGIYVGVGRTSTMTGGANAGAEANTSFGVMKYSFDTKKLEEVVWFHDDVGATVPGPGYSRSPSWINFTPNKIVCHDSEDGGGYLYDFKGNLLRNLPSNYINFSGGTDEYIYFMHLIADKNEKWHFAVPLDGGDEIVIGYAE